MTTLLAVLLSLAGPGAAQTNFDRSVPDAMAAVSQAAQPLRSRPRELACAVEADRPIEAIDDMKDLRPDQRFPVDVKQADPTRVEVRAQALPLGFQSHPSQPGFVKAAGVMIREKDAKGYWLLGLLFIELDGGGRQLKVWQATYKNGETSKSFDLDLSRAGTEGFSAVIPSQGDAVPVRVLCSVADVHAPTR